MRSVLIVPFVAIALAVVLLGTSEIVQSASAVSVTSKSGAFACTDCANGKPTASGTQPSNLPRGAFASDEGIQGNAGVCALAPGKQIVCR